MPLQCGCKHDQWSCLDILAALALWITCIWRVHQSCHLGSTSFIPGLAWSGGTVSCQVMASPQQTMSPRVMWGLSGQGEPGVMGPPTFQACSGCVVSRLPAPVSSCQGMDPVLGLSRQCQKCPCGGTGSVVLEHPCARMGMGSGPKAPGLGVKQVFGDPLCQ